MADFLPEQADAIVQQEHRLRDFFQHPLLRVAVAFVFLIGAFGALFLISRPPVKTGSRLTVNIFCEGSLWMWHIDDVNLQHQSVTQSAIPDNGSVSTGRIGADTLCQIKDHENLSYGNASDAGAHPLAQFSDLCRFDEAATTIHPYQSASFHCTLPRHLSAADFAAYNALLPGYCLNYTFAFVKCVAFITTVSWS
jgi:hypothetical protein